MLWSINIGLLVYALLQPSTRRVHAAASGYRETVRESVVSRLPVQRVFNLEAANNSESTGKRVLLKARTKMEENVILLLNGVWNIGRKLYGNTVRYDSCLSNAVKKNSVVSVRKRTIPTKRPQPADEVSANFS
jgi:hypothetical protein